MVQNGLQKSPLGTFYVRHMFVSRSQIELLNNVTDLVTQLQPNSKATQEYHR